MSDFIVFGGINMDLFAYLPRSPEEGETIEANSIEFFLGGKGANQAVALARLGAKVSFVGTVGKDLFGQINLCQRFLQNLPLPPVSPKLLLDSHLFLPKRILLSLLQLFRLLQEI